MAAGNRFQLIDEQTYLGQQCNNVYYYRQATGATDAAANLITGWLADMLPKVLDVQSTGVVHNRISSINVDNPDDFLILDLTADNVGTQGGDGEPPYVAFAFRYNRTSRAVRNGQKRIAGVAESSQANGEATGAVVPNLLALAVQMGTILSDGDVSTFEPVIFHRLTGTPTPPLSSGLDYAVANVAYIRISTQNTRKFGRGS